MKTYHFAIYNPETKAIAVQCQVAEDTKTIDEVPGYMYPEEPFHLYQKARWELDVTCRGNPWALYYEVEPFDIKNMVDGTVLTGSMKKALKEATK